MNLTELFKVTSPSVVGFISKLANTPVGSTPHFPPIFGTGFFIDSGGVVVTNRHVVEVFETIPTHPKTGDSALAELLFLREILIIKKLRRWQLIARYPFVDKSCPPARARRNFWRLCGDRRPIDEVSLSPSLLEWSRSSMIVARSPHSAIS